MNSEPKTGFWGAMENAVRDLARNPRKLLPGVVLVGVWAVFSLLSAFAPDIPLVREIAALSYANGGMYGGAAGAVGGICGKMVFAAVVNYFVISLCARRNPFSGIGKELKGVFAGGLAAVAALGVGGGLGVLLYWFFNLTATPENAAVAVVAAAGALSGIGKTMLHTLVSGTLGLFSPGKKASVVTAGRVIVGVAFGFTLALPLTFVRSPWALSLAGLALLAGGGVLALASRNVMKKAAVAVFCLAFPLSAMGADSVPAGYDDPLSALSLDRGFANSVMNRAAEIYLVPVDVSGDYFHNRVLNEEVYPAKGTNTALSLTASPLAVKRGGTVRAAVNGGLEFSCNGYKSDGLLDYSKIHYKVKVAYSAELALTLDGCFVTFSCSGREDTAYSATGTPGGSDHSVIGGDSVRCKWEFDRKTRALFCRLIMPTDKSNNVSQGLIVKYRVAGVKTAPAAAVRAQTPAAEVKDNKPGNVVAETPQRQTVSHPDNRDLPSTPGLIVLVSLLGALLGGGGAVIGAAAGGAAVSVPEDLGPYLRRDADGDLTATDPATGEKRLYRDNGDGTYTNPLTGATYSEDELRESLAGREENAAVIRADADVAREAIADQRTANAGVSFYDAEAKAEKAAAAEREEHDKYITGLAEKYRVADGDEAALRAKIGAAQGKAEIEAAEHQETEAALREKQEYLEKVETAADVSLDALTEVTGRKDIKAGYTALKSTLARGAEAHANGKSVMLGVTQGAIEGAIDVAVDNVDGAGAKLAANMVGASYKNAMDATINHKNVGAAALRGIGEGALKGAVDVGFDTVGEGVNAALGDAGGEVLKNVLGTDVTKKGGAGAVKAVAGDMTNDAVKDTFSMPDK